jgi:Cof subfamily protein (haloacid dehalogenase superfamily)
MRVIASDLDGTIVRADGSISRRTVSALAACQDRGVDIIFVTGRPPRWMGPIAQATEHRGIAVCGNGALVYDLGTGQVVRSHALSVDAVLGSVAALRSVLSRPVFALETLAGFRREPDFLPHHEAALQAPVGSIEELLVDQPVVVKVLCRDESSSADPMLALARPVLAGIAEAVHSNVAGSMLELSALGVSKASTLAELVAERGGTAADVVAFGDMPNDVAMLRWAGLSFAVAGGHPDAIAAADQLAPPCDQDGVAQVLERLLLTGSLTGC